MFNWLNLDEKYGWNRNTKCAILPANQGEKAIEYYIKEEAQNKNKSIRISTIKEENIKKLNSHKKKGLFEHISFEDEEDDLINDIFKEAMKQNYKIIIVETAF